MNSSPACHITTDGYPPISPSKRQGRRLILAATRCVRVSAHLSQQIDALADKANKHPSNLIRDAIVRYVKYYQLHPEKLDVTP